MVNREKIKKKLATLCLMTGMFLNPLGFDIVQLILIRLTGSLLGANLVLYCLSALFFGLYFYFSYRNNQKYSTICLMIGMFFCPIGFDIVQFSLITLVGSIIKANLILYAFAISFFGLYFYIEETNPITEIKNNIINTYLKIKKS
jgi:hypothetical protein